MDTTGVRSETGFFRMPPEWEPHRRCWMIWPVREACWIYGNGRSDFERVRDCFLEVARAIALSENVAIVGPDAIRADVERRTGFEVEWFDIPSDDAWARDVAPTFVQRADGGLSGVDWTFNGWGGAFAPFERDAKIARGILRALGLERLTTSVVAEGGALQVNGAGLGMATEATLLSPGRNGPEGRAKVESVFEEFLGVRELIWLPEGLPGDDTGGHVDVVAAFLGTGIVGLASPGKRRKDWKRGYERARRRLASAAGGNLEVMDLPLPSTAASGRYPFSYLNFYLANGSLILPSFGADEDGWAAARIAEHFPDREVRTIDARPLYLGGGGIHCITQQEPLPGVVKNA